MSTDFQLREKQKAKFIYGVLEKPFRNYSKSRKNERSDRCKPYDTSGPRLTMYYSVVDSEEQKRMQTIVTHKHVLLNGKTVG